MKTWHFENLVAIIVLATVAFFSPNAMYWYLPWISSFAVFCAFCHNSISERMRERIVSTNDSMVECHRLYIVFWVLKEICFALTFILSGLYPLLAGNVLFLLYPVWRKVWRKYHPLRVK